MGIGLAERSIRAHNLLEYIWIDKREDCITVLCGAKISLYTGRPSEQITEDCPPEPVLGDSVMSGRLLISGRHLILTN